jgi:hypothetical protein
VQVKKSDIVDLNRRFRPLEPGGPDDLGYLRLLGDSDGFQYWDDLQERRRVVLLAEAGSGKSSEVERQALLLREQGKWAFVATMQEIGEVGLRDAIDPSSQGAFDAWKASDEPAWIFCDSVDEARAAKHRLDSILRKISAAVSGCTSRAHIVITARHSIWQPDKDLDSLNQHLPLPPDNAVLEDVEPEALIARMLDRQPVAEEPKTEQPLVVVMDGLDEARIGRFALARGLTDVPTFMEALRQSDFLSFARRPLDLAWLTTSWLRRGSFGRLRDVLKESLNDRIREHDVERDRRTTLTPERGMLALERVGAALVMARTRDVEIPDDAFGNAARSHGVSLRLLLDDFSGEERHDFIGRGVFEPASHGFARLHNDNEGQVAGYLAAEWLIRLLRENCSEREVHDLLFATTYGTPVVRPSMRQTAAWLSIASPQIAHRVLEWDPRVLMDAGDPASLSLDLRVRVLRAVVAQAATDGMLDMPSHDNLRRFTDPGLAPAVYDLWTQYEQSEPAREILLAAVWLGRLEKCLDIAIDTAFANSNETLVQFFAGRAVMEMAPAEQQRRYASYVCERSSDLPHGLVWESVERLFPQVLAVDELLKLLDLADERALAKLRFDHRVEEWGARARTLSEAEALVEGVLERRKRSKSAIDAFDPPDDDPLIPLLLASTQRFVELLPQASISAVAIEATLHLASVSRKKVSRRNDAGRGDLSVWINAIASRRRAAMWAAAERFRALKFLGGRAARSLRDLEMAGIAPTLHLDDMDWLLADVVDADDEDDRLLAIDGALTVWKRDGEGTDLLARIRSIAETDPALRQAFDEWLRPPPLSDESSRMLRTFARQDRRYARTVRERNASWVALVQRVRDAPDQLQFLPPPSTAGIDSRLFHLWKLLSGIGVNRNHFAISDLSPLRPLLGEVALAALADAFVTFWRQWRPELRSERELPPSSIREFDCIGLVGVSIEASRGPDWAQRLLPDDAEKAAIYATLELNGFPDWTADLAKAHPEVLSDVLMRAVLPDLDPPDDGLRSGTLDDIVTGPQEVADVVAGQLFAYLESHEPRHFKVTSSLLRIVRRSRVDRARMAALMQKRFVESDGGEAAAYGVAWFELAPVEAMVALEDRLQLADAAARSRLMTAMLPGLVGGRRIEGIADAGTWPTAVLERLVIHAYASVPLAGDRDFSNGAAFSPNERDDAADARSALLGLLVNRPGLASYRALQRLATEAGLGISKEVWQRHLRARIDADSERAAWTEQEVYGFETFHAMAPRNPHDLLRLVLRHLDDLNHELRHGDHVQGKTVASMRKETEIQNWIADWFRRSRHRSYNAVREPHVADEKKPDTLFLAHGSQARVPMEIKVLEPEGWTLQQLESALQDQFVGQYLRDADNRYGILLLVCRERRPKGWQTESGAFIGVEDLVARLRSQAEGISASDLVAPQPHVSLVDVSWAIG